MIFKINNQFFWLYLDDQRSFLHFINAYVKYKIISSRFQKLVWSGTGVIVGGCDGGLLQFYSAEKLLQKGTDPLLGSCTKHNGKLVKVNLDTNNNVK